MLLCGIPLVLWATALPLEPRFSTNGNALTSIGVLLGLAGASAFAVNLFLGARFKFAADYFGGLDALYKTHRINGRVAFLLLCGHALFIAAAQSTISWANAFRFLFPDASTVVRYGEIALLGMAVAIFLTLYAHVGHEVFIWVQRSFGFIFMLAALHIFMTAGAKAASPALTYYMLVLTGLGLGGFAYRSLLGDILIPRRDYRVTKVNRLDDHVLQVTMESQGEHIDYTPGQFVFVDFHSKEMRREFRALTMTPQQSSATFSFRAGAVRKQFHPFSITSSPNDGHLQVAIKASGDYTNALHVLEKGALVRIEGPFGVFSHRNVDNPRQVWVAGGIGVTPFLSMARSLEGDDYEIDFYYCTKTLSEAYFIEEFEALAARYPGFNVITFPEDERGFISADELASTSGELGARDFLICGPPVMILNLKQQLEAAGVPPARIHFEEFGFVG